MAFLQIWIYFANVMALAPLFHAEVFQHIQGNYNNHLHFSKFENRRTWTCWKMRVPRILIIENLQFWDFELLKSRHFKCLKLWGCEALESLSFGTLNLPNFETLELWNFGTFETLALLKLIPTLFPHDQTCSKHVLTCVAFWDVLYLGKFCIGW